MEEVTFSYGRIEWKYTSIGPDGRPMGEIRSGWDLMRNVLIP
jgi:type VI protein secretion system component Hcp